MVEAPPVCVSVTPGATSRLVKPPTGALSKLIRVDGPSRPAAASKLAAAAFDNGRGSVGPTPGSMPENVTMAASTGQVTRAVTANAAEARLRNRIAFIAKLAPLKAEKAT